MQVTARRLRLAGFQAESLEGVCAEAQLLEAGVHQESRASPAAKDDEKAQIDFLSDLQRNHRFLANF